MTYLPGQSLKPYIIDPSGQVFFTDGTNNNIRANQPICEAYGYTYDSVSNTCLAFPDSAVISTNLSKGKNTIRGVNSVSSRTQDSVIIGQENTTNTNRNCLVVGNSHTLEPDNNNASVVGGGSANVSRQGEVAMGGGNPGITDRGTTITGDRQMSLIQLSGITIDNTATKLTVQGDGSSYINVRNNSILGYEIYLTRFELGGSAGTAGNYSFREIKGAVQIDNSYNMAFVIGFTRKIAKIGVNGTYTMVDSSATDPDTGIDIKSISVEVTDRNNVNNLWSASVYLHEVVSTAITF